MESFSPGEKKKLDSLPAFDRMETQMVKVYQVPGSQKMVPFLQDMTVRAAIEKANISDLHGYEIMLNSKTIDRGDLDQKINPNDMVILAKNLESAQ